MSAFNVLPDGDIDMRMSPDVARLRLAELEADPAYVASLLDLKHPLHRVRTIERQGLEKIAATAKSNVPWFPA
jgi:hypothetical protein